VGRIGGYEMGESGGEDIGSVTHGAATLVDEFQFLHQNQKSERKNTKDFSKEKKKKTNSAFVKGEEFGDEEALMLRFKINLGHNYSTQLCVVSLCFFKYYLVHVEFADLLA